MYNALAAKPAGAMSHPVGAFQGRDVGNAVVFRNSALYYAAEPESADNRAVKLVRIELAR